MSNKEISNVNVTALFEKVAKLIEEARRQVAATVNLAEVYTKYNIGRYIVEAEQQGNTRAQYGEQVLKSLSERLKARFGEGWSYGNLKTIRRFYLVYSNRLTICDSIQNELGNQWLPNSGVAKTIGEIPRPVSVTREFVLPWSHYLILMRVENPDARSFYEIECVQQQWSKRQLSRQIGSSLYERLALSRNKDDVMRLATEGQTIEKPSDIIKDPLTLEFLGLTPDVAYTETKLENAIIDKMQQFLLELGKGFLL